MGAKPWLSYLLPRQMLGAAQADTGRATCLMDRSWNQPVRLSAARKAISDYRKAVGDAEGLASVRLCRPINRGYGLGISPMVFLILWKKFSLDLGRIGTLRNRETMVMPSGPANTSSISLHPTPNRSCGQCIRQGPVCYPFPVISDVISGHR